MGELGDVLGEDFETEYENTREERREKLKKVEKGTLMEIAYQAVEGGKFDGEEPRFRFEADEVTHDVLLMESPDRDIQKFRHSLGEDAMTLGMFHLDQLFSCAFQDEMLDVLDKIEEDQYYLVVGNYEEKTETKDDGNTETYYNINPVRGIIPLNVAQKYAEKYESKMEGTSIEEQSEQQKDEVESGDDGGIDLGGLNDDESDVPDDDIVEVFHAVGDNAPEVLEQVAEGVDDAIDKLLEVTHKNLDGSTEDDHILDVFEDKVEDIPGRGEDEDSGIDIGGIGGDDEGDEDDGSEDLSSSDDESEDEDSSSGVEDWF